MRVGDIVFFGRPNGEQTKGEIVKVNRKTFKVRTLEERGNGRGSGTGTIWTVARSLCKPAAAQFPNTPTRSVNSQDPAVEALVASALRKLTGAERFALAQHYRSGRR